MGDEISRVNGIGLKSNSSCQQLSLNLRQKMSRGQTMKLGSAVLLTLLFPAVAFGLVYIYPNKGQISQQQDKDRYDRHLWAVQQTGFDPSRAQAAPAPSGPQAGGEIVRGTARGALVGTVGGAIAGNAGTGAAMGGLLGGMKKMDKAKAQQQQQAQQQNYNSQQQAGYGRALGACMSL
jgi:hypothetical protein